MALAAIAKKCARFRKERSEPASRTYIRLTSSVPWSVWFGRSPLSKRCAFVIGCERFLGQSVQWHEVHMGAAPGIVDQLSAHGSSRYSEEMHPIPQRKIGASQPDIHPIDQFRALERVVWTVAIEQTLRQAPQMGHHNFIEAVLGSLVPSTDPFEKNRYLVSQRLHFGLLC